MYVYGLCLLFDFATKNLHFATIFYHLVDKCDLRILLISSPDEVSILYHPCYTLAKLLNYLHSRNK